MQPVLLSSPFVLICGMLEVGKREMVNFTGTKMGQKKGRGKRKSAANNIVAAKDEIRIDPPPLL
jgi:hypothetical protein